MAFPVAIAVTGAIELIKLGAKFLETYQNNPNDQDALEKIWKEMQAHYRSGSDAWEASKQ